MSKPNMYCGECPYWLAYGELETTDEQNEAILAHCKECDFDPDAVEELDKVMRAVTVQDDYDPYTGKYAFVSPDEVDDEEYEAAAQAAHDELVRSLIEAGGEIRELKEILHEAKNALLYMLILHKAQDPRCNQEKVVPALYMLQSGPDKWTPERADEVFKKVFDYLEQEKDNGT